MAERGFIEQSKIENFVWYHTYDYNEYIGTSVELQFDSRKMTQLI